MTINTATKYILYGGRFTRTLITEMVMAEGGIDYELREIDIIRQQHKSPEFLAINPAGLVPALITPEQQILYETPAINLYLAERHQLTTIAPAVGDPDRGPFLSGLFYLTDELEPAMKRYFYPHRYALRNEDLEEMKQRAMVDVAERLKVVNQRMEELGPYDLGNRFSLVDLTLAYWVDGINAVTDLSSLAALQKCIKLVVNRPRLQKIFNQAALMRADYAELQKHGKGVQ